MGPEVKAAARAIQARAGEGGLKGRDWMGLDGIGWDIFFSFGTAVSSDGIECGGIRVMGWDGMRWDGLGLDGMCR